MIDSVPYDAMSHRGGVRELLAKNGWEERYIADQLAGLDALSGDPLPGRRGKVFVCEVEERLSGFVCVEYREWNRLGQLQGLAVDPALKRRGIAFSSEDEGEIYALKADGSGRTRLTDTQGYDHWPPTWSPDGTRIAFTTENKKGSKIYVMNSDGSGLTRLTDDLGEDFYPAWRP